MAFGAGYLKWPGVVQTELSLPHFSYWGSTPAETMEKTPLLRVGSDSPSVTYFPLQELVPVTYPMMPALSGVTSSQLEVLYGPGRMSRVLEWPGEVTSVLGGGLPAGCRPLLQHIHVSRAARRGREQPSIVTAAARDLLFVWV